MDGGVWQASVHGVAKSQTRLSDFTFTFHFCAFFGEGNGNPLQCSCLENPRDGGAWWAAVYGVAQSRTWLKLLSSSSSSYIHMNQPWVYMCSPPWTPLPPPSPSHPSGLSQCTGPERPVSCIEPGLVIYFTYGNIYVSMLFSQIIPPSPSPIESKSLFFTSVSLLLSRM